MLDNTGADAIMIGRAAQGNPWLFKQIDHFLNTGKPLEKPDAMMIRSILLSHLEKLYSFYGDVSGVRIARKHIGWYFKQLDDIPLAIRNAINQAHNPSEQIRLVHSAFDFLTRL